MRTLKVIDSNTTSSEKAITDALRQDGVVVVQDFCNSADLSVLKKEFQEILSGTHQNSDWFENRAYSLGKAALLTKCSSMKALFPGTFGFFDDPFMQKVTDDFLGKGFHSNRKIFVVKDVVGTVHHANDLHFDVEQTLKFFLYLTDTAENNGAFRCVVGSHKESERIRKENPGQISYQNREFSRKLPFGPEHTVSVNGKAGSLIIFDTNVFHQAGKVTEGERWVMRGQTEAVKEPPKKLSFMQRIKNKLS